MKFIFALSAILGLFFYATASNAQMRYQSYLCSATISFDSAAAEKNQAVITAAIAEFIQAAEKTNVSLNPRTSGDLQNNAVSLTIALVNTTKNSYSILQTEIDRAFSGVRTQTLNTVKVVTDYKGCQPYVTSTM